MSIGVSFLTFLLIIRQKYEGTLSRTQKIYQLPVSIKKGSRLDIFVENQGRVCYGTSVGEKKAIIN